MFYCSRDLANQRAALERCRSTDKQTTDEFRQTTGHTWAFTKYLFKAERMFTKIYFQLSIPIKDTTSPLSHHTLASSKFFQLNAGICTCKGIKHRRQLQNLFNERQINKNSDSYFLF